ncbi:MAG: FAD-binding oxidoreductase [Chloroflexi bacterium]|nr:FAD-binding oxidoreductase [Chloroflexota bacterium]
MSRIFIPDATNFPASCDLAIIGGGVIGTATAFYAKRAGLKSIVVEKRAALGELTTSASLAAFRAQFAEKENIALMKESIAVFEQFRELTGTDIGIHQQGYLFVTTAPDGYERSRARALTQMSFDLDDVELFTGDECRARFPYIAPEVTAATFRQRDGWLSSHELTYGYARASDAQFFVDTKMIDYCREGREAKITGIVTSRGEIHAEHVVICGGPFAAPLAKIAGIDLPLENIRRQQLTLGKHPHIPRDAPMTVDSDTGAHWRPEGQGAVFGWSRPEPPAEPMDYVPTDWEFPALVLDGVARITPFWNDIIPSLKRSDLGLVAGQYTEAPDLNPLVGATQVEGLWLNCAYGGHGVMSSAGGARIFIDVVTGKMKDADNPFRVSRLTDGTYKRGEKMVL